MKLNHKIEVNILEFILTGKFDFLEIGKTRGWIADNFPDPDDFGMGDSYDRAPIWRYGNIELHFVEETLYLIYSDYIGELTGGGAIDLDAWILNRPEGLGLETILHELNNLTIDYSVTHDKITNTSRIKIKESKVELLFDNDNEDACYKLRAFSLM